VLAAQLVVTAACAAELAHRRVYAFAGIGRSDKFFASLAEVGACCAGTVSFPDHYAYRASDIASLQRAAKAHEALLVTTEKDFVRLRPWDAFGDPALPAPMPVPVEMQFSEVGRFDDLVAQVLRRARAAP
jgi:tetraacyldisaccharide 4'-kinase